MARVDLEHRINPDSALYGVDDVCVLLRKSRAWVFAARKRGVIPMSRHLGGESVWNRKRFDAWLQDFMSETVPDR